MGGAARESIMVPRGFFLTPVLVFRAGAANDVARTSGGAINPLMTW